jgi:hypothetical protein
MLPFVVNNDTIKVIGLINPLLQAQPGPSRIRTGVDEFVRPGGTGPNSSNVPTRSNADITPDPIG